MSAQQLPPLALRGIAFDTSELSDEDRAYLGPAAQQYPIMCMVLLETTRLASGIFYTQEAGKRWLAAICPIVHAYVESTHSLDELSADLEEVVSGMPDDYEQDKRRMLQ